MKYWKEWLEHCGATEKEVKMDSKGQYFVMVEVDRFDESYKVPDMFTAFVNEQKRKEQELAERQD